MKVFCSWLLKLWEISNQKLIIKINSVEFMYVESCYKSSTSKYEKSNRNINISKIYNLPFDMFSFSLEKW